MAIQIILSAYVILNLAIYLLDFRKMQKGSAGEWGLKLSDFIENQSIWYKIKTALAAAFISLPIWIIATIAINKIPDEKFDDSYEKFKNAVDNVIED